MNGRILFAVIDRLNSDGSPIYKLKQAAYDYVDKMGKPKIESTYNRIYLTHLADGVLRIK